jgi:hypothetical protein
MLSFSHKWMGDFVGVICEMRTGILPIKRE